MDLVKKSISFYRKNRTLSKKSSKASSSESSTSETIQKNSSVQEWIDKTQSDVESSAASNFEDAMLNLEESSSFPEPLAPNLYPPISRHVRLSDTCHNSNVGLEWEIRLSLVHGVRSQVQLNMAKGFALLGLFNTPVENSLLVIISMGLLDQTCQFHIEHTPAPTIVFNGRIGCSIFDSTIGLYQPKVSSVFYYWGGKKGRDLEAAHLTVETKVICEEEYCIPPLKCLKQFKIWGFENACLGLELLHRFGEIKVEISPLLFKRSTFVKSLCQCLIRPSAIKTDSSMSFPELTIEDDIE